jgi:plasmid replication initiation protein
MVTEITNQAHDHSPLLPDRHPQQELFVCDVADAVLKDDMASMEHPVFTLSTKPDLKPRRYEHGGKWLEVTPSVKGMATIYDKDILIYAISQLMAAKKQGKKISKTIRISARDFLIFSNRLTGGREYNLLVDALTRLRGTTLSTNVATGGEAPTKIFGLVDEATVHRNPENGRVTGLEIKLSDWLYNAVGANEVLTLHPDYFRLRKPLERRIYEIARKHCGVQLEWRISLSLLKKKCGSNSPLKHFRYLMKGLVQHDHFPDYTVSYDAEGDMVRFSNRRAVEEVATVTGSIHIDPETYNDARTCAPGWDVYYLETLWRSWMADGGAEPPKNPNAAFLGFCRRYFERNGSP